jgi:hypothetical protein
MRKIITVLVAASLLLVAAPAAADARTLSKSKAAKKATQFAKQVYLGIDEATAYARTRPRDCVRMNRRTVDCLFAIYFEDEEGEMQCVDDLRIKMNRSGRLTVKLLPKTDISCEYV